MSKNNLSVRKNRCAFETYLADYLFTRILRHYRRSKSFRLVVVLPPGANAVVWSEAVNGPMAALFPAPAMRSSDWDVDVLDKGKKGLASATTVYSKHVVVVAHDDAETALAPEIVAGADNVLQIGEITARIVQKVAKLRLQMDLDLETAEAVARLSQVERDYVMRPGANIRKTVARLAKVKRELVAETPVTANKPDSPRLEDLHGYGEAQSWGIQLARDLADYQEGTIGWDDVDRGLLLSGSPGTGKTTYARALAETCGVALVTGSYSEWQSAGHQGDMLKAMRDAFKKAAKSTPSILFIDEMDAFCARSSGFRDNEYMRGVVNGLLECMDGAAGREGIVVIGATNDPDNIDPAVKRSGRLDRHIEIQLPDATSRAAILKYHLQSDVDVREVIGRTEGMSGADLERIARDARRKARVERRLVRPEDLVATLPPRVPYSAAEMWRIAIHESGHAVVGMLVDVGKLHYVEIEDSFDPAHGTQSAGRNAWTFKDGLKDRSGYEDMIAMTLAALEAERAVFGVHFDGATGDLGQASIWAAAIVSTYGMDGRLVSIGDNDAEDLRATLRRDARLQEAVDRILQAQRERARALVEDHVGLIRAVAERLLRERRVEGEAVGEMVRRAMDAPLQLSLVI